MIRGENITLRVVQEKDLETLFRYYSDLDNRGEFFPLWLPSEAGFKHDFHRHGFWRGQRRRLVIVDQADVLLGSIWFYQPQRYFDALEIGYLMFDRGSRNKGYRTESLALLARYLFATRNVRRLQLTVVVGIWPPSAWPRRAGSPARGSPARRSSSAAKTWTWSGSRCSGRRPSDSRGGGSASDPAHHPPSRCHPRGGRRS